MSVHNFIHDWLMPPKVYREIGQFHFDYLSDPSKKERELLAWNYRFKNKYTDKRCFVIANGSSLNGMDLLPLKDEVTIVMNSFHRHPMNKVWQPTFHITFERAESFKDKEYETEILASLTDINPSAGHFVPLDLYGLVPPEKTYYMKTDVAVDTLLDVKKPWAFEGAIPGSRTTTHAALMLAMYIGCNPIYLIGCDSDWLSHEGTIRHFYKSDPITKNIVSWPYGERATATGRWFRGYEVIRKYAERRGIDIVNATNGGFLDVYEREKYDELFR